MRLIDAELLADIKHILEQADAHQIDAKTFDEQQKRLNAVKSAYVEPVRHGKWEVAGDTTHYYICSICGNQGDWHDNYCRSCGAKMEVEEDESNGSRTGRKCD